MRTSPRPRCTRNSPTTTCATSTTGPTRAPTEHAQLARSPALCLVLLSILAVACSRPGARRLPPTASSTASPAPAASAPIATIPPAQTPVAARPDDTDLPGADPFALASRLLHVDPPRTVNAEQPDYQIGSRDTFWLEELSGPSAYQVNAVLRYRGEHAWLYLQERAQVADAAINHVGETFDREIYPNITSGFGPPLSPGIDRDPRVTILLADLHGLGGYFTQIDDEPASIERTSNQRKIIYLDVSAATPGGAAFDGNVAHEFQHLVHYARNPDAQSWINEGMSELARAQFANSLLNIPAYEDNPDTQLNDWPTLGEGSALPHYGAAQSFLRYLLQHYGGIDHAARLAAEPGDGIAEVRAYLSGGAYGVSFEDVFADWLAANLINDPAGGRFSQGDAQMRVRQVTPVAVGASVEAAVHQFGARYYSIIPTGRAFTVAFAGSPLVSPLPTRAAAGATTWWSRRGDSIDATLTRGLDLTGMDSASLQYDTWFDLEMGYDYGYVEVSSDGGVTWNAIAAKHSRTDNPLGIALGPAYTGASGGGGAPAWIEETADLTPYAGRRILIRFEYVTDESANRNGWAIANVRVPEIGFADPQGTDPGWSAQGFVRVNGDWPQRFIVQAVLTTASNGGTDARVQRLQLDARNQATLAVPPEIHSVVLIVSGATDLIRTPATFRINVQDVDPHILPLAYFQRLQEVAPATGHLMGRGQRLPPPPPALRRAPSRAPRDSIPAYAGPR